MKNKNNAPVLYIAVPCYNEEEVINQTIDVLTKKLKQLIKKKLIDSNSKIYFINDGSRDRTWEIIKDSRAKNSFISGISLSRNRGHQNALLAGLMTSKEYADIVVSMDADLQDDVEVVDDMILEYNKGSQVVYGVRSSRKKDSFFKRWTAQGFYKFMKVLGVDIVYNHADYRLMSKSALDALEQFDEVNIFLRGMIPLVGFKSSNVYYERKERAAGTSKYPLKKMLSLALDGITSFSVKPLKIIANLGFIMLLLSIAVLIYSIVRKICGLTVSGWTFIVISIWFVGAIQILFLGIIGEYIGKIYSETKKRPKYIIEENLID